MRNLKIVELNEVSLVDAGANQNANIVLFKRKKSQTDHSALQNSQSDASLTEMIKRLSAKLEEQVEKAETAELQKIAEKYEILGENSEELVKNLKFAKSAGNYDTLISLLEKSLSAVEKSGQFTELGKSGFGSQAVSIEKIAKKIQEQDPTISRQWAIERAFQLHPELEF